MRTLTSVGAGLRALAGGTAKPKAEAQPKAEDEEEKEGQAEGDPPAEEDEEQGEGEGGEAAAEGEDEPEEEDEEPSDPKARKAYRGGRAKGVNAERKRTAKVLRAPEAAGRLGLAARLLALSDMSADAIVETLKASPAEASSGDTPLGRAMRTVRQPELGAGDSKAAGGDSPGSRLVAATKRLVESQAKH